MQKENMQEINIGGQEKMSEIKWIKIVVDIFDDEKILLIESLPEADSIIVIWFKLLCLAGKQNNSGVFVMSNKIPYTDKMLATIFRRKESTVKLALETFKNFGMIEIVDGAITIPNWGKHQNFDKIEKNNEYMKNYMREYRNKQKLLAESNCKTNSKINSKTNVSALEENRKEKKREEKNRIEYNNIVQIYNENCFNLSKVSKLTEKRRIAIRKFLNEFTLDDFINICNIANNNDFLIGKNDRNWKADFDFLLRTDKATAILEGKYTKKRDKIDDFIDMWEEAKYEEERNNTGDSTFSW